MHLILSEKSLDLGTRTSECLNAPTKPEAY